MSDEPNPQPLRLKPREAPAAPPAAKTPPAPPPVPASAPAMEPAPATPPVYRKPQLVEGSPAFIPQGPVSAPVQPPPASPVAPVPTPKPSAGPLSAIISNPAPPLPPMPLPVVEKTPIIPGGALTIASAESAAKAAYKLKPHEPPPPPPPAPVAATAPPPASSKQMPAGLPISGVPHVRAAPVRRVLPPPKPPPAKLSPVIVTIVAIVLLGLVGFIAYQVVLRRLASSAQESKSGLAAVPAHKPAPGPTPSETLNQAAAMPAQMIDKAKAVVDAHTAAGVEPVNEVIDGQKPVAPAPATGVSLPATKPATTAPAEVAAAPASVEPQAVRIDLAPTEAASPAFKAFITSLRVSGVFQGAHPRVLIGSRTYEVGEVVNEDLGVVFVGVDPERKLVLLKDGTGITLVKKY